MHPETVVADDSDVTSPWRLRAAALLTLGAVLVFAPLQYYSGLDYHVRALWPAYLAEAVLSVVLIAASYTAVGRRHADGLSIVFIVGVTVQVLWGFAVSPFYPTLAAFSLTCVLGGAVVFFGWGAGRVLALAAASLAGFGAAGLVIDLSNVDDAPFALSFFTLVVGAVVAAVAARVLDRSRAALAMREQELAALSARLMSVQEEERRRISRELHDELGQSLTAVSTFLWLLEQKLPGGLGELRAQATDARRLASQTLAQMRELSQLLRPSVLDSLGLVPSLDSQLQAFSKRHKITTRFHADELPDRLPVEVETALFRIAQEALTNVARHSQARQVDVSLTRDDHCLCLEVQDHGVGLPAGDGPRPRGTGLVGIRERVRALGGTVAITSGSGTRLEVRLPLPRRD
jgi:signal transduction histidine kinase